MRNKSASFSLLILATVLMLAEADATLAQQQPAKDAPLPVQVYVVGQVVRSQAIPFKPTITILQAIAMAGDVLPDAARDRVRIYRTTAEKTTRMVMNVSPKAIEKQCAEAILLQPNDVVEVVSKKSSKQLKKECPKPLCFKVEPLPKHPQLRVTH